MLSYLIQFVFKYRQDICIQNISRAFPDLSYLEIKQRIGEFYTNFARIIWEIVFFHRTKLIVDNQTADLFDNIKALNRPVILLLGHYGNWEVLNRLPMHTSLPVQALYKPLKNKIFNMLIVKRRSQFGVRLIESTKALRTLIQQKDTSSVTLFISDQYPGNKNGLSLTFLNQPTYMFTGAEAIARRINAYVAYLELRPVGSHSWTISIQTITENAALAEKNEITKQFTRNLEGSIQHSPSWWLWSHRRWK
ncbi:lysophospholipid acyltransferase family protein [Sphingobacterium shayense]|uniref:lysophospholipid acyltransferase family protein n=1 Tax=Sphingobacterium shayense TaxID=626343 RepID=UPI0015523ABE|nr:lysophospholipid acyltransferase family protein [Sphingobacterium shayense]NQD72004.1 lysophospholipid acyltransferase family protein [Sphingobacterium shayense]